MKRVWVEGPAEVGACLKVDPDEMKHLIGVRRAHDGELVEALDGKGFLAEAQLRIEGRNKGTLQVTALPDANRESPLDLHMGLVIPTHLSTLDGMLPGLVQLGVTHIHLFPGDFGGRLKKDRDKYESRLQGIALQALKQSGRLCLPKLLFWKDFPSFLASVDLPTTRLMFHPGGPRRPLESQSPTSLLLLIGPEGGFSQEEVDLARGAGVTLMDLGPRILKMETAAIGAAFWAQTLFGD